jgi:hypothetical protein
MKISYVQQEGFFNQKRDLDVQEGLNTIATRSKGLVNFVNAYRDATPNIPLPNKELITPRSI